MKFSYTTAAAAAPASATCPVPAALAAAAAHLLLRSLALRARAKASWCKRRRWLAYDEIGGWMGEESVRGTRDPSQRAPVSGTKGHHHRLTLISACLRHFRRNWLRPVSGMMRAFRAATGLADASGEGVMSVARPRVEGAVMPPTARPPSMADHALRPLVEADAANPRRTPAAWAAREAIDVATAAGAEAGAAPAAHTPDEARAARRRRYATTRVPRISRRQVPGCAWRGRRHGRTKV